MRYINLLYLVIASTAINAKYSSGKVLTVNIMKICLQQIDKIMDQTDALRNSYWKKYLSTYPNSALLKRLHYKGLELSSKDAPKLSNYILTLKDFLSAFLFINTQSTSIDSNLTKLVINLENVMKRLNTIIVQKQIAVDKSLEPKFDKRKVLKITEEHLKRINSGRQGISFQRNLLIHAFTNQFSTFLRRFRKYLDKIFGKHMYVRKHQ